MPTSKEELLRRGLQPHDINHNQCRRAECRTMVVAVCI